MAKDDEGRLEFISAEAPGIEAARPYARSLQEKQALEDSRREFGHRISNIFGLGSLQGRVQLYATKEERLRERRGPENAARLLKGVDATDESLEEAIMSEDEIQELETRLAVDAATGALTKAEVLRKLELLQRYESHRDSKEETHHREGDAEKSRRHFSVVMVDLDFFKRVNDRYGHLAGDAVLRELVARVKHGIREERGDFIGRWGGEEFIIVLLDANGKAEGVANRLREAIKGIPFTFEDKSIPVTASMGVATHEKDTIGMIKRADEALYASKHGGRDKVTMAPTTLSGGQAAEPATAA